METNNLGSEDADRIVLASLVLAATQLATTEAMTWPNPAAALEDRETMLASIDRHFATAFEAYHRHMPSLKRLRP